MYDLLLTANGDIAFEVSEQLNDSLQLNFITSKSNALSLNFYIDNFTDRTSSDGLSINFRVYKPNNNKTNMAATDAEFYEQAIRLRLETPLGSINGNRQLGSKIEMLKHEFIDKPGLDKQLKDIIKEAIQDILPNAIITIVKTKTPYMDYSSNLRVLISDKDKQFEYQL
jgi:phage baseplate assembly protein W